MPTHQSPQSSHPSSRKFESPKAAALVRPFAAPPAVEETLGVEAELRSQPAIPQAAAPPSAFTPPVSTPAAAAPPVQAKLTIGQSGDKSEQEADPTASEATRQTQAPQDPKPNRPVLQRQEITEEEDLQTKPEVKLQREVTPAAESAQTPNRVANQAIDQAIQRQVAPAPRPLVASAPPLSPALSQQPALQRQETSSEEEEPQREPEFRLQRTHAVPAIPQALPKKPLLQRQADQGSTAAPPGLESSIQQARGGGQALADTVREPMEQAFHANFSGVKVHTDAQSDQLSRSIQAKAFTTGQDVFFRQGAYDPGSPKGQELLAHELTHVVQQGGAKIRRQLDAPANPLLAVPAEAVVQAKGGDEDEAAAVPASQLVPPPKLSEAFPAPQFENDSSANGQSESSSLSNQHMPPLLSEALPKPEITQEEDLGASNESAGPSPELVEEDGDDGQGDIDVQTIKKSLKKAGDAYQKTENIAMQSEKLYYSFSEDKDYVQTALDELHSAEIDAAQQQVELQIQAVDDQLQAQPAPSHKEVKKEPNQKENPKDKKHELAEKKKYLALIKDAKKAQEELGSAEQRTEAAKQLMVESYKKKSHIGMKYSTIEGYRAKFPDAGKTLSNEQRLEKQEAKKHSTVLSIEAKALAKSAEDQYKTVKEDKAKLVKAKRIAPEFAEQPGAWMALKLKSKVQEVAFDFGVGLVSAGIGQYKAETDKRGFQKPGEWTTVFHQAKEAFTKIRKERSALQAIKPSTGLDLFTGINFVVGILETLDRVLLSSVRRVIRFIGYESSIISGLFPPAAAVFAPIVAITKMLSGVIALVQIAVNALIISIRGMQVWHEDATLANILKMSLVESGVQGGFSVLKYGVNLLEAEGYLGTPSATLSVNANDQGIEGGMDQASDLGKQFALDSMGADASLKLGKSLTKEGLKSKYKPYKNYGKIVKGDLQGGLSDEAIAKPAVLTMFKAAVQDVVNKAGPVKSPMEAASAQLSDGGAQVESASAKASGSVQEDAQASENAQESLQSTQESGGVLKESGDLVRDLVELI